MTIKEVEERTGLSRSNVRFYEKEELIAPSRNESNGYREYSESDVENIKKIAYLRTLGISIENIRNILSEKTTLHEVIRKQRQVLEGQITDLNRAKAMCEKMLTTESVNYKELRVEQYVVEVQEYWNENPSVFKLDSVSFLYLWGSFITWAFITAFCFLIGLWAYPRLPQEIPVQWKDGAAVSFVNKIFIFVYPMVCIAVRYLLRRPLYVKLQMDNHYGEIITEYLTNYMCFVVLSAEVFSILFLYGAVKNIAVVLFADTVVLIGLLIVGIAKLNLKGKWRL